MIRMGRGSRTEPAKESTTPLQTNDPIYGQQYNREEITQSRVVSDSESMARDIKEGRLSGFVGHGTTLTGETVFEAMLRVDGHLKGSITSEAGTLIVGANGQVDANIAVATAVINGAVNGDIIAQEKIQLGRTARVIGNIQTPRLMIEEGAVLEGGCTMLKSIDANEKRNNNARNASNNSSSNTSKDAVEKSEAETKAESAAG